MSQQCYYNGDDIFEGIRIRMCRKCEGSFQVLRAPSVIELFDGKNVIRHSRGREARIAAWNMEWYGEHTYQSRDITCNEAMEEFGGNWLDLTLCSEYITGE